MKRPPILARALLRVCLPARLREAIAGDIEEQWHGSGRDNSVYWRTALSSIADCWRERMQTPTREERTQGDGLVASLAQDARFAARMMLRAPGFTAGAVCTLALGIGGSTAIFSTVKPALFDRLPYPNAERILSICDRGQNGTCVDVTFGTYREVVTRSRTFDALAVMRPWQPVVTGLGDPERLEGQRVSAAYFDVLGIPPAMGRGFGDADDRPGAPRVALLADGLWRRRFGADPGVIGRPVILGDIQYTIVGVLPRTFENVLAPQAQIWTPLQYDPALPVTGREWGHHLRMAGRLTEDISAKLATEELDAIARAPVPDLPRVPWASLGNGFIVSSLRDELTRDVKPVLLAFFAAVVLVLTIASANVANLLLGRALHRRREFAVRAALGAGRGRLVRQLLTEGLAVAMLGGILGVIAAQVGVDALVALRPPGLPRLETIAVDRTAIWFALAVTLFVGTAIALVPAFQAFRGDLQRPLRQDARTTAGASRTVRQTLVIAEVALALVLLVSAGLLFRSLRELVAISPGFDASSVTTAQVQTVGAGFQEIAAADQFFARVLERVRALPGIAGAAATSLLPLGGDLQRFGVFPEHAPQMNPGEDGSVYRYAVSPGYFEAMGIPLRRGRLLADHDRAGGARAVVISERLAARQFRGLDPLGKRLRIGPQDGPWFTVVGIVGDVKQSSLDANDAEAVYTTPSQWLFAESSMWIVVRSDFSEGLPTAIRDAVWSVDGNQPVVRITTMAALMSSTTAERRFALLVFGAFGAVAVLLSVTGLYSALARSVTERTREIGVRAALGATRAEILSMVLRQGLALAVIGVGAGVAGAVAVTRLLETLLFGTTPTDPATYAAAAALFLAVAALASTVPALRAATIDPAITLRAE